MNKYELNSKGSSTNNFIMLNRFFCNKLNAKCIPVLDFISSFEGTHNKKLHGTTSPFVSCCFIYISRFDFLQVFRNSLIIIGKSIFVTNATFLMDSPKPLHSLNS